MRGIAFLVLLGCVAMSLAVPSSSPQQNQEEDSSKVLMKRDYKAPATPIAEPPADSVDNGYYYYYYPVEEDGHKAAKKEKDLCDVQKLMIPLILITIFLGIIAANAIGLLPAITLPAITIPVPGINKGRDLADAAYDYIPWGSVEKLTVTVMDAVESEECLPRLICESGRYAEGREVLLSLLEFFTPRKHLTHMKIFKDSALKKSDCRNFKCSYVEEKKL